MLENTKIGQNFDQQLQTLLDIWSNLSKAEEADPHEALEDLQSNLQNRLLRNQNGLPTQDVYKILVEQSFQGLAIIQDFDLVYANPILTQITGYTLDEMQAFSAEILRFALYDQEPAIAWLRLASYLADGVIAPRLELCFPQKNGSIRWAEIFASCIIFQGKPAILVNFVDLTDRKQAELELEQLYARLELEVRERAEELATTNGALQAEVMERKQAQNALQRTHAELEIRVQQRTEELANVNEALKRQILERQKIEDVFRQNEEQLRVLASRRRHLAQQVVKAQEEERYRVSRELHDEAGQALTALKVSLEMILTRIPETAEYTHIENQVFEDLQKALLLCETTSAQIRSLAHDLRPAALDDLGLDLALQGFCHEYSERTNLSINYSGSEELALSDAMGICLYRILQESLTNVAKHARAKQVQVILAHNGNHVTLSIVDDGQGFSPQSNLSSGKHKPGIGLIGMQERLESLGGQLNIESGPGIGTRLLAVLPYQERNN